MYMYEVCAKCGHVGRNNYVNKVFAITAESGKEAAKIVREKPRVKHNHKDAIRYVKKIDETRYYEIKKENSNDPYFKCKNIQEQRNLCNLEILPEINKDNISSNEKEKSYKPLYCGKNEIRNPKKYINNYLINRGIHYGKIS